MDAGKFFRGRREVGVLHLARLTENRRIGQRFYVWRTIELIEKIREATVKRITVDYELRKLRPVFSVSYFAFFKQTLDKILGFHRNAIGRIVLANQVQLMPAAR